MRFSKGHKLTDEISVQEMLEYREQGFTNKEIAELLDVHQATIYKYIGRRTGLPHQKKPRKAKKTVLDPEQYAACKAHIEAKKAEAEPPKPKNRLKIENVVTRVTGEAGGYTIDQSKKEVSIDRGVWKFDELAALLGDIEAIRQEVRA